MFYTVMRVKGRYYLYKVIYVGRGKKKFIYVGPCDKLEEWWARGDSNPGPPPRKGEKPKKRRAEGYNPAPKLSGTHLVITPALVEEFVRWCVEELGNAEATCRDRASYLRKPLDLKNSHSVKAHRLLHKFLGKEPPAELKVPRSGVDFYVPSDEEVLESLERARERGALFAVYKLLVESGARLGEVCEVLRSYEPSRDARVGEFYAYALGRESKSKRSFYVFHVSPLQRVEVSEDYVTKLARELRLVRPKRVRKWVATKMLSLGVPAEVVDFIQGRAARSVLARHYLNLYALAQREYAKYAAWLKEWCAPLYYPPPPQ